MILEPRTPKSENREPKTESNPAGGRRRVRGVDDRKLGIRDLLLHALVPLRLHLLAAGRFMEYIYTYVYIHIHI